MFLWGKGGGNVFFGDGDGGDKNAFFWPNSRLSPFAPLGSCEQGCPPSCFVVIMIMTRWWLNDNGDDMNDNYDVNYDNDFCDNTNGKE